MKLFIQQIAAVEILIRGHTHKTSTKLSFGRNVKANTNNSDKMVGKVCGKLSINCFRVSWTKVKVSVFNHNLESQSVTKPGEVKPLSSTVCSTRSSTSADVAD